MFDRYTESAQRVLFFAREDVSHLGATELGAEHLLLGLCREPGGLAVRILELSDVSVEDLREDVLIRSARREEIDDSVEIPLNADTQRALRLAVEEADRLIQHYVGTEHLLLGLLRTEGSLAWAVLGERGLRVDDARNRLVTLLAKPSSQTPPSL